MVAEAKTRTRTAGRRDRADGPGAGLRRRPGLARLAILDAAAREFAAEGPAGARMGAIARAAGVNKALLYYYFRDKERLYGAVLDRVFEGMQWAIRGVLHSDLPPRKKLLAVAAAHFDYIAQSPLYPRLVMREMMRAGRDGSPHLRRIVGRYFQPMARSIAAVLAEAVAAREIRPIDPMQFLPSMVALNVFYFTSAPVVELIIGGDPLTPERVKARRAAVLDFISAALTRTPTRGRRARAEGARA